MALLGTLGTSEIMFILIALIFTILIPILALIDIVRSKFEGNAQLMWVIIVVFVNIIGAILYFAIGMKQKKTA